MKSSPPYITGRFLTGLGLLMTTILAVHADYTNVVLNDHPIAYYPINSDVDPTGATATDLSGNGNNGTYYSQDPEFNSVPGPSPYLPHALNFDGGSSYVDLGTGSNPTLLNFSGTITMEAWAQPATPNVGAGTAADIIGKGYDGNYELCMRAQGGNYYGGIYNGNTYAASGGNQTTSWTYLVSTYDGTNWNLFVNGVLVQSNPASQGSANFSTPWAIGVGTPSGNNRWFQGNICQVALYTNALSASQVYNHYFAGQYGTTPSNSVPIITTQPVPQVSYVGGSAVFSVSVLSVLPTTNQWLKGGTPIIGQTNQTLVVNNLQAGDGVGYSVVVGNSNGTTNSAAANLTLITPSLYTGTVLKDQPLAYCPLDPAIDTSATAYDLSGNGNNGVYANTSPGFNTVAGPSTYIPNAANFNGSTYADLSQGANPSILNFGGQITLEAWVQPSDVTKSLQDILAKGYDNNYNEIALRQDNTTFNANGQSGGPAQVGVWTYVVSTYDGAYYNLYINGIQVAHSQNGNGVANFTSPWRIGSGSANGANRLFTGNLSQIALYNHGLSSTQVLTHYLVGQFGTTNVIPIIISQPQSQTNFVGGTAIFNSGAVSLAATTNQWFKDGSPLNGQTNSVLTLTNLQLSDSGNYTVTVGNVSGTTNSMAANLIVRVPYNLVWSANNNNGIWDTITSANWTNLSTGGQTVFITGDAVTFDDTVGVPTTAVLGGTVQPSVLTVNSSTNNFTIARDNNGNGILNGSGSIVKKGTSKLIVNTGGSLTGTATIAGGQLYAGNNSFANISAITITNNATLDLGGGTLGGNKPITVSGTGSGGLGAIDNTYNDDPQQLVNITLAGDTTLGANYRWDVSSGSQIKGAGNLTLDFNGNSGYSQWNSVSIGSGIANIIVTNGTLGSVGNDAAFQNSGTLTTISGNSTLHLYGNGWNSSLHVLSGGQVYLDGQAGDFNGNNLVLEDNAQWQSFYSAGDKHINSPVTLNGNVHMVVGDHNLIYTNVISGPGGFVVDQYSTAMVFAGVNTYAGSTVINSGPQLILTNNGSISHSALIFFGGNNPTSVHIDASGRSDQTLTLASGQTLAGIGAVNGNLVVSAGATLSPAGTNTTLNITTGSNATGTIGVANSITLNGTTVIKLNGSGVNDSIQTTNGTITYGGTLNVVNLSSTALAAGDSFQISARPLTPARSAPSLCRP